MSFGRQAAASSRRLSGRGGRTYSYIAIETVPAGELESQLVATASTFRGRSETPEVQSVGEQGGAVVQESQAWVSISQLFGIEPKTTDRVAEGDVTALSSDELLATGSAIVEIEKAPGRFLMRLER